MAEHHYNLDVTWQGAGSSGTTGYREYGRQVLVRGDGKPDLLGSADTAFRGEPDRWNPEEMLLAALSQCHLLSYLHVAVSNGIVVTAYEDHPVGTMLQESGGGRFTGVTLRPVVTIEDPARVDLAMSIHHDAGEACFIASSVNFPVTHEPRIKVA